MLILFIAKPLLLVPIAAEVLEILLHLHFDIVPREVGAELVAIGAEFVGNSREKDFDRHWRTPAIQSRAITISQFLASENPPRQIERK